MAVNLAQPAPGALAVVVQGATALGQAIRQGQADDAAIANALGLNPPPPPKPATDNGPIILIGGLLVLVGVVAVVLYVVRRK